MTISNILIIISAIITTLSLFMSGILVFGMNHINLVDGHFQFVFLQFILYQFLHGGLFHLMFNSIFIFIFGNGLEDLIGKTKYMTFFIFNTVFVGLGLLIFTRSNTIGISGFCMALLSYFTLELYSKKNPEYKGGITAIVINLAVGFMPGISLIGHLFGVISGVLFFLYNRNAQNQ